MQSLIGSEQTNGQDPIPARQQVNQQEYADAFRKNERGELDPEIKRKVLEIFNEIWYEYDEDEGQINMARYKQIMNFAKKYKGIQDGKTPENDPFADRNLELAFQREDEISYNSKDKVDGKISHKSVLYIAHDIFQQVYNERRKRVQRKKDLQKKKEELNKLREKTKGVAATAV